MTYQDNVFHTKEVSRPAAKYQCFRKKVGYSNVCMCGVRVRGMWHVHGCGLISLSYRPFLDSVSTVMPSYVYRTEAVMSICLRATHTQRIENQCMNRTKYTYTTHFPVSVVVTGRLACY